MAISRNLILGSILAAVGVGSFCCCGGGGLLFYWVFEVTGEGAKAADEFLALVGQGKITEAYNSAATGLHSQQTEEAFAAELRRNGLTEYASHSWSNRSFVNDRMTLVGSITTKAGAKLPITVLLVKESGTWRVWSMSGPAPGIGVAPPDDQLRLLVSATMVEFGAAVKAKDFKPFHSKLSTPLKREKTPEGLQKAFEQFFAIENDLPSFKDVPPVFTAPPAINDKGQLHLTGYFPTKPGRLEFDLTYTYEHPEWKVIAIDLRHRQ